MRTEIRIGGFGGQGILMCGIIIAKAASLYDHKFAVQTQSYGPEARGGASRTEVVLSDEQVDYPKVDNPEIFVAMSHEAFMKYVGDVKDNAILITDPDLVDENEIMDIINEKNLKYYTSDATRQAQDTLGLKIVANIVMLGSFVEATGLISQEAAKQAILDSVPKGTEDKNLEAFELGRKVVKKVN